MSGTASVYVGDLADAVTEQILHRQFSGVGSIQSVRLCRDPVTGKTKNYGYVNYAVPADAQRAVDTLNHVVICGQAVRVMPSQRDASLRQSGIANLFVKNLQPELVTNKALHEHFSPFGVILSAKVAVDSNRKSRGYGFVQYADPESAKRAIEALDATEFCGVTISVAEFMPAKDRAVGPGKFFNVYVKNIGSHIDEDGLQANFDKFGPITSTVVMRNSQGRNRGFGFVNFRNSDDAATAVAEMDGHTQDGLRWKVSGARRREENPAPGAQHVDRTNVCVKHSNPSVGAMDLKRLFQDFGPITSVSVVRGPDEQGKGIAFLHFEESEDAEAAITALNGSLIPGHPDPISVSLAPRRARQQETVQLPGTVLQDQRADSTVPYVMPQIRPMMTHPNVAYYPGPQLYYSPSFVMPSGQQQLHTAYMPVPAPGSLPVPDQRSNLLGTPSHASFAGQGTQMSGLPQMAPMIGTGNVSYDAYIPTQQYWFDQGILPSIGGVPQDSSFQSFRSQQRRPVSRFRGLGAVPSVARVRQANSLDASSSNPYRASQAPSQTFGLAQPLPQAETRPVTGLTLEGELARVSLSPQQTSGEDAGMRIGPSCSDNELFTTQAAMLLSEGGIRGMNLPSTSAFNPHQ